VFLKVRSETMTESEVIIIGAGASGLMCAIEAGKRGRRVIVLERANSPGKKILISGGGRCNFTNRDVQAKHYLSSNEHFCKSALSRFTPVDFLELLARYDVPFHERDHGRLFCDDSAKDILNLLLAECRKVGVTFHFNVDITTVERVGVGFQLHTNQGHFATSSLVVATGGLSIPKMGATPFGYKLAEQFGVQVVPTRAGLVPFTWPSELKESFSALSGIAVPCAVSHGHTRFEEDVLFTHRGLSGPGVLQISSYWKPGEDVVFDFLPGENLEAALKQKRQGKVKSSLKSVLEGLLPKRLVNSLVGDDLLVRSLQDLSDKHIAEVTRALQRWTFRPGGTEGYRTAEVTIGGVDCEALSSKTMECRTVPGLFFVGEVVDVTGWLGGYNFQWAWASGWSAGQFV
jgi:predicted Rossmann fold flavoprotein